MVGSTWEELAGKSLLEVGFAIDDVERDERMMALEEMHHYKMREARIRSRDGSTHDVLISAQRTQIGREEFDIEIMLDITERKKAQARDYALKQEQEHVRVLLQLLQNAAHEFRTPLSVIQVSSYLLMRATQANLQEQHYNAISDQIASITRLLDDLLILSELDSTSTLNRVPVNLSSALRNAFTVEDTTIRDKHLRCELPPESKLPVLSGNPEFLGIALHKLVNNAVRYTPEGGQIQVIVTVEPEEIRITIRDSGIGISTEHLAHIFERFYRIDTARSTRGLGLGLPIAQRVVELHGGQIEVSSALWQGSVFTIRLPQKTKAEQSTVEYR